MPHRRLVEHPSRLPMDLSGLDPHLGPRPNTCQWRSLSADAVKTLHGAGIINIQSTVLLQRTAVWRVWRADVSSTRLQSVQNAPNHANHTTAPTAARASTQDSRLPSWSFSVWPARHWRIWQTTVSFTSTSARADSDQPTQRRASSDVQIPVA